MRSSIVLNDMIASHNTREIIQLIHQFSLWSYLYIRIIAHIKIPFIQIDVYLNSSYLCEYKMQYDFPCAISSEINNKIYSYIHRAWSKNTVWVNAGWYSNDMTIMKWYSTCGMVFKFFFSLFLLFDGFIFEQRRLSHHRHRYSNGKLQFI